MSMDRISASRGPAPALVLGGVLALAAGTAAGAVTTGTWHDSGALLAPELLWVAAGPEADWMARVAPGAVHLARNGETPGGGADAAGAPPAGTAGAEQEGATAGPASEGDTDALRLKSMEERFFRRFGGSGYAEGRSGQ
jgi:hypothetical protein